VPQHGSIGIRRDFPLLGSGIEVPRLILEVNL
jgi:hypothetical protein